MQGQYCLPYHRSAITNRTSVPPKRSPCRTINITPQTIILLKIAPHHSPQRVKTTSSSTSTFLTTTFITISASPQRPAAGGTPGARGSSAQHKHLVTLRRGEAWEGVLKAWHCDITGRLGGETQPRTQSRTHSLTHAVTHHHPGSDRRSERVSE